MAASPSIDLARFVEERLAAASPDLLRAMLEDLRRGAHGRRGGRALRRRLRRAQPGASQLPQRLPVAGLGHPGRHDRGRDFRSSAAASYFPDWLLERRRRAEQALITVVATSYLLGVSTRRVERLVEALGIARLSKS